MEATVSAIYENGVLRLLEPLPLPEHTAVEVTVAMPSGTASADPRARLRAALVAAGLSRAQPTPTGSAPFSAAERNAIAHRVAPGRPLSEIINDEREGR